MRRATTALVALSLCLAAAAGAFAQQQAGAEERLGFSDSGFDFELDLAPAGVVSPGRALLQQQQEGSAAAGSYGGYGDAGSGYGGYGYGASGTRRRLMGGGYGGYGDGGYGGYGYGAAAARSLIELGADDEQQQQEQEPQEQGQQQQQQQQQQARGASAAPAPAPPAPGTCYCRYDADYNTWALAEAPCKAALAAKCAAGQLPCAWLDAYYGHAAASSGAHSLPHERDILGFVFDDCRPAPPCACAGVKFDGDDAVTATFACCRDLRAACRAPFDGLSCGDVEAFCKDDAPSTKLLHWAQRKLQRAECRGYAGAPYEFVPLGAAREQPRRVADAVAEAAAPKAIVGAAEAPVAAAADASAPVDAAAARGSGGRAATAAVGLGALLVAVAAVGMAATLRGGDDDGDDAHAPLLHAVPELQPGGAGGRGGPRGGLARVVSSNYLLSSLPPSRTASTASFGSAQ